MKYLLNTKTLDPLKKSLPDYAYKEIAEKLSISRSSVSRALSGKTKKRQVEIVELALEIVDREKKKLQNLTEQINTL